MQIDAQQFLNLAEKAKSLCFFDIESSGLSADYHQILCATVKPFDSAPTTFMVESPASDRKAIKDLAECLATYDVWCGYYSKGFDVPMIQTRLLRWGLPALVKKHHLDLYFILKFACKAKRNGLGNWLRIMDVDEKKMDVGPEVWAEYWADNKKGEEHRALMQARCESDCSSLEKLYVKVRHLVANISR